MTEDEWNKVIGVNLSGAFFLAQAALAHMLERGSGRIVMVSSVIGETGAIGQANYAASKAGLFGLTKTLAREACFQMGRAGNLADNGIGVTVNAITPGFVATEMVESVPEKILDRIKGDIPMGRLAQPWEVARVVHFLAGRLGLHHWTGLGRQRWAGDVIPVPVRSPVAQRCSQSANDSSKRVIGNARLRTEQIRQAPWKVWTLTATARGDIHSRCSRRRCPPLVS